MNRTLEDTQPVTHPPQPVTQPGGAAPRRRRSGRSWWKRHVWRACACVLWRGHARRTDLESEWSGWKWIDVENGDALAHLALQCFGRFLFFQGFQLGNLQGLELHTRTRAKRFSRSPVRMSGAPDMRWFGGGPTRGVCFCCGDITQPQGVAQANESTGSTQIWLILLFGNTHEQQDVAVPSVLAVHSVRFYSMFEAAKCNILSRARTFRRTFCKKPRRFVISAF